MTGDDGSDERRYLLAAVLIVLVLGFLRRRLEGRRGPDEA